MTRVHGDIIISRREGVKPKSIHYGFKNIIKEDFKDICGYCGKNSRVFKEDYQIDHFIPKDFYKEGKGDYYNLVYSCRQCNRNKWNKWPTRDIYKSHDGKEGFVDPVLKEYDEHLKRDESGKIIALTSVGKYMIKELKLDLRHTEEVWAIMKLANNIEQLKLLINEKSDEVTTEHYKKFFELSSMLDKYLDELYNRR